MEYNNLDEILETIRNNKIVVLTGSTRACGVCTAVKPRLKTLLEKYNGIEEIYVYVDDLETAAGEFMIFTVPTIVLFIDGKEVHRESRIIDFEQLEFEISRWRDFLEE